MKELYRALKTKTYFNMLLVIIIGIFFAAFYILMNQNDYRRTGLITSKYDSISELVERLEEIDDDLTNLMIDYEQGTINMSYYQSRFKSLNDQKVLVHYLIEHEIPFDDFRMSSDLVLFSNDQSAFIEFFSLLGLFGFLIVIVVVNVKVFCEDFSLKTSRFIYLNKTKNHRVLFSKLVVSTVLLVSYFLVFLILMVVLSKVYLEDYQHILIMTENGIIEFSPFGYKSLLIISSFTTLFILNLLIVSLCVLLRNPIVALVGSFGLAGGYFFLTSLWPQIAAYFGGFHYGILKGGEWVNSFLKLWLSLMICIIIFVLNVVFFRRRSLE